MKRLNNRKQNRTDILRIIFKPFLMIGYVIMLFFGLIYYFMYSFIVKLLKKENYYENISGFVQSIKSIVFSNTIRKHSNTYYKRAKVKKTRKQSAGYFKKPKTRAYNGNRATTRADQIEEENTEPQKNKNYPFKRFFAYAAILFLKEDVKNAKVLEIDQKYPPRHAKVKEAVPSHENNADSNNTFKTNHKMELVNAEEAYEESNPKRAVIQKRIMIGSVAAVAACALIFVGALAYAQELPVGLNFISPEPTASLFQTMVPVSEDEACEILPESEESLYLAYPDDVSELESSTQKTSDEVSAAVDTTSDEQEVAVSGNITTQPKIYKQGDEDPEVAKIQKRLMELHYMSSGDTTNYYGKKTTYAMKYFQRQHNLQVDGTVGAETLAILYSDKAEEYKVEEGTEGTDVKEIQERLYDLKYLSSSSYVTGYFGTITQEAVKDFQSTNSLSSDGIVGYNTYKKLFSSSAIKNSTSSSTGSEGATGSGSASDIVKVAKSLKDQGYIYVWGGKSPSDGGFDCSGFVYYVLNRAGIKTGYRDTSAWATTSSFTTVEDMEDVEPGDVLVFSSGHVAIYIGDGKMIHSTSKSESDPGGIYIDNFFTSYRKSVWIWGKRIAD